MAKINTHYDNLEVPRNASPEVIHAAYEKLSKKLHPDKNQENPEAARTMSIINTSYKVLSDPDKRQKHDQWIATMEAINSVNKQMGQACHTTTQRSADLIGSITLFKLFLPKFGFVKLFVMWAFFYILGVFILLGALWFIYSIDNFFEEKNLPSHSHNHIKPPLHQSALNMSNLALILYEHQK
ncbi:J domain-containing protein [Nitrosomonas communis]|uniref:J domain-containing protein n=1 Tax=Nitrosomonas communis TaxID=44574 RepID=UPI003D2751CF